MGESGARYPALTWVTRVLVTLAIAVAIRLVAAVADLEVLVPDRAGGAPVTLTFGPIVAVTIGAFLVAIVAVLIGDRLLPGRSRRVLRLIGVLVLLASLVPVWRADLPDESTAVLTLLHLVVGASVLSGVVRE